MKAKGRTMFMVVAALVATLVILAVIYWHNFNLNSLREGFVDSPAVVIWKPLGLGSAAKVTIGGDGAIYAVNSTDSWYAYSAGKWVLKPGSMTSLKAKSADELVGLERNFTVYKTTNATSDMPDWTRINASRFDTVSIGYDGSIWATVLPVDGTWGIYSYDTTGNWNRLPGSLRQVSVRNKNEAWGVGADGSIWRWIDSAWKQIDGSLAQVAVGIDGDVWGVNASGQLWHRTSKGQWQQAKGTYMYVDVKDGNTIVAVDVSGAVLLGSVQAFGTVVDPVETAFSMTAYSGGSAVYSDDQKSQVGWAELTVNDVGLVGKSSTFKKQPSAGLNVVVLSEAGNALSMDAFDTGSNAAANDAFVSKLQTLTSTQTQLPVNLYGSFRELVTGGKMMNNGLGVPLADGSANPGPNYSLDFQNHLTYTGTDIAGVYEAAITPGTFTFSITYSGDGSFDLGSTGSNAGIIATTLNATATPQTYTATIKFTTPGLHQLTIKNNSAKTVTIINTSLSKNDDATYPPSMLILMVHGDGATSLSTSAIDGLQRLGATQFRYLKPGGSYLFIYDILGSKVLSDALDNAGHVKFVSEGKSPVIDSSFNADGSNLWLTHGNSIVKYDLANSKLLTSSTLDASNLPVPFNSRIDTALERDGGQTVLLTRGRFWILVKSDLKTVLDGPDVIGQGVFPITQDPFSSGLDSSASAADGNYYIFKKNQFAKISADWKSVIATGSLGSGEFAGLPRAFTKIVHAAFSTQRGLGLVSYDKLVFYDPQTAKVVEGPVSLLSDTRFAALPLSFKVGNPVIAKPFDNHTRFAGQLLRNFDISVTFGEPHFPGWSPDTFSKLNHDVSYNWVLPPIKTTAFTSLYPDVVKTYGTATNDLLTAYAKYVDTAGWDVPRYSGNTVTFALTDKKQSAWRSHSDSPNGKGYNYADLRGGGYYSLSIWAMTEDAAGFSVGAYTGSPEVLGLDAKSVVNLSPVSITADKDWQVLTWNFHNPPKSLSKDVSFTMSQASNDNSLHSLYGPVLKASVSEPDYLYMKELLSYTYIYFASVSTNAKMGFDGTSLYTCSDCKTVNGVYGLNERFCLYKGRYPNTIIISSYANYNKGPLNLAVVNGVLGMSTDDASACSWCMIKDSMDVVYLINYDSDMILTVDASNKLKVTPAPVSQDGLKNLGWNVQLEKSYAKQDIYPKTVYIEAAFAKDANNSPEVFLIRRGIICSYNVNDPELTMYPVQMSDHSVFQKLPERFLAHIDSAFVWSGTDVLFFERDEYLLWDLSTGLASKNGEGKPVKLGPGGGKMFAKLPGPFNKHIDASFKLDVRTVVLVSESSWLTWDLSSNSCLTDPALLSTGIFQSVSSDFRASIDAASELPGKPGTALLFSGAEYTTFDFSSGKAVDGISVLGPASTRFASLIPPFIPSHDETCAVYKDIIVHNTDYPKQACTEDPTRPFKWQTQCLFDVQTCDAAGGIYNDDTNTCGTAISKGTVPLKQVDAGVRKQYADKYLKECKTVTEADYVDMKSAEKSKYDSEFNVYTAEKAAKQDYLNRIALAQKNIDDLNGQLKGAQLELTKDTERACHPNVVCLKPWTSWGFASTKEIPLGCNKDVVQAILQKDNITQDDVQVIIDIIKKANVINQYPIEKHPDYAKYVNATTVKSCPSVKRKTVRDFALSDFPSLKDYISLDKLLPPAKSVQLVASDPSSSISTNGMTSGTPAVTTTGPNFTTASTATNGTAVGTSVQAAPTPGSNSVNTVNSSGLSNTSPSYATQQSTWSSANTGFSQSQQSGTGSGDLKPQSSTQTSMIQTGSITKTNKPNVDFDILALPTGEKSKIDPAEVKSYLSFVDQVLSPSNGKNVYSSPYFTQ